MISLNDSDPRESFESIQKRLEAAVQEHNSKPQTELAGLSPVELYQLLRAEWDSPQSPLKLNKALPPQRYLASPFFQKTRLFLIKLRDENGVKPTQTGNLPRSFVAKLIDDYLDGEKKSLFLKMNKVVNEMDLFHLHVSRLVCEIANLVGKSKGRFVVRKKALRLLEEQNTGELFATLLLTCFRRFNLEYLKPWSFDFGGMLQNRLAYPLWCLHTKGEQWTAVSDLPDILLPTDSKQVAETLAGKPYWTPAEIVYHLVAVPLMDWGFMESQNPGKLFDSKGPLRPTALFREVFHFDFSGVRSA